MYYNYYYNIIIIITTPCLASGMRAHPPIAICDLEDHIEKLKANECLHFSQEYEVMLLFFNPWHEWCLAGMDLVHFFSNRKIMSVVFLRHNITLIKSDLFLFLLFVLNDPNLYFLLVQREIYNYPFPSGKSTFLSPLGLKYLLSTTIIG